MAIAEVLPRHQRTRPQTAAPPLFMRAFILAGAVGLSAIFFVAGPAQNTRTAVEATQGAPSEVAHAIAGAPVQPRSLSTATAVVPGPRSIRVLTLYLGPSEDYMAVGQLPAGASLQVLGRSEDGHWLAIAVAPGSELYGWALREAVADRPPSSLLPTLPVRLLPSP